MYRVKCLHACRVEARDAVRLALENEKLREENAQLRELLDLVGPVDPARTVTPVRNIRFAPGPSAAAGGAAPSEVHTGQIQLEAGPA